jgi:hypothetical protein
MEMYQKVMIPLFGVENYENTILQIAQRIKERREKKPTPLFIKVFNYVDNLFKD